MSTTHADRNPAAGETAHLAEVVANRDLEGGARFRTVAARLPAACLFWLLCLTLTAGGHRLYMATVTADHTASAETYRANGAPLVWVGHGTAEAARTRIAGQDSDADGSLYTLPNSLFWLGSAILFTVLSGLLIWSGRWIADSGIQSLFGLFAGHFLWLGAVEFGLDAVGRRIGLAGSMEMVGGRVVGTHSAGILIQMSVVFLAPMLIGLAFHESNRCAVFQWFRRRLPIIGAPAASGRVENYAARTAMQYFMTVWFCYVSVLWMADPRLGSLGEMALLLTLVGIAIMTPYMIWRTASQASKAQALRYSVSGAVVGWTAIEIAAAMQFFHEPWLSTTIASGAILLGLTIALTVAAVRSLQSLRTIPATAHATATLLLVLVAGAVGCTQSDELAALDAATVELRLQEYDDRIGRPEADAADGLLHALYSNDPEMRAQAAVALGKAERLSPVARERLESIAADDSSRLSQFAALMALHRCGVDSEELDRLQRDFISDPEWGPVISGITR